MSRRIPAWPAGATVLVLALGSLVGCSQPAVPLDQQAAAGFQARVLSVSKEAAAKDYATAAADLDVLSAELEKAAAAGKVSFARHQEIAHALGAVRADLSAAAAQSAAEAAARLAAATPGPTTAPVVPAPAPAVQDTAPAPAAPAVTASPANGNNGNGNGNGNGKDGDSGKTKGPKK